jgi:hypothetical protein
LAEEQLMFDYVDLNQIDPTFSPLPEDMYKVRIVKAEKRELVYKTGARAGQTGQVINLQLAVVDHPSYSGRRLFEGFFPNNFSFRVLRRLADITGIQQEPGTVLDTWLTAMTEAQPTVKLRVGYKKDRDGNVIIDETSGKPRDNAVDWREMQPGD